jgi:DNA-binding IclR family transcriptional regulator
MSEHPADDGGETVQTVQTAFRVLETLTEHGRAGVTELATMLDLSKSAVHRHLSTLVAEGYVEQVDGGYQRAFRQIEPVEITFEIIAYLNENDAATAATIADELGLPRATIRHLLSWLEANEFVTRHGDKYENGLKFLEIGERVKHSTGVFDIAAEEVDRLAAESDELALFSVLEHDQNVLMYKSNGENAIHTSHEIGLREPLHCSGLGKAILSELPDERVERIVDEHGLPSFTDNTITDRDHLFEELQLIREQGYALDDEEAKPGIRCIAAPVVIDEANLYGGVSVTAPRNRMQGKRIEETLPELVTGVANVIEVNAIYV